MQTPYAQVRDLYDTLHAAGVVTEPLKDWSSRRLAQTGNPMYEHGVNDNWLKRMSHSIDKGISATGADEFMGRFGRSVGELIGDGDSGEMIGRHIPRGVVEFAPLLLPVGGVPATIAKFGLTGLLSGAGVYTRTNSPAAGLLGAATTMAMPGVARAGEIAALKALGVKATTGRSIADPIKYLEGLPGQVTNTKWWLPQNRLQGVVAQGAGQVAASLLGETSAIGQTMVDPNSEYEFSPTTLLLDLTLGQVPFGAVYALKQGRVHLGGRTTRRVIEGIKKDEELAARVVANKEARDTKNAEHPIEGIPLRQGESYSPTEAAQVERELQRITQAKREQGDPTSPTSKAEFDALDNQEVIMRNVWWEKTKGDAVPGVAVSPESFKPTVRGFVHFERPETGYRIVKVEDPQGAVYRDGTPVEAGDLVGFAAKFEPEGNGGDGAWVLPEGKFSKVIDRPYITKKNINQEEAHPELPRRAHYDLDQQLKDSKQIGELVQVLDDLDSIEAIDGLAKQLGIDERHINYSIVEHAKRKVELERQALELHNISEQLKYASTHAEIDAVAEAFTAMEMAAGRQPLPEKVLFEAKKNLDKRIELNEATKRKELQAKVNRRARAMKNQKRVAEEITEAQKTFYEFEASVLQQANSTTLPAATKSRYQKLRDLIQTYKEQSGTADTGRRRQVLESPEFKKKAEAWLQSDKSIHELSAQFRNAIDTGAGLKKARVMEKVELQEEHKMTLQEQIDTMMERIAESEIEDAVIDARGALNAEHPLAELRAIMRDYNIDQNAWDAVVGEKIVRAPISAGANFIWGGSELFATSGRFGHVPVGKDGGVGMSEFESAMQKMGVPKGEKELYRMIVPEAFTGDRVNVKALEKGLRDNVVVETHTYGQEGKVSEAKAELDKMTHEWWDTLTGAQQLQLQPFLDSSMATGQYPRGINPDIVDRYGELWRQVQKEPEDGPRATSYYDSISPFDTKQYPVVRVDVTLPKGLQKPKKEARFNELADQIELSDAEVREFQQLQRELGPADNLWEPDNLHENLPNTLGWAMVQVVPGSDGRPVMFVGEQQSRWGQVKTKTEREFNTKHWPDIKSLEQLPTGWKLERFDADEWVIRNQNNNPMAIAEKSKLLQKYATNKIEQLKSLEGGLHPPAHPLLEAQHSLVLKAVIAEARKQGVDTIVLSDPETAMMTEMHDKTRPLDDDLHREGLTEEQARLQVENDPRYTATQTAGSRYWEVNRSPTDLSTWRPSQARGMTLHYATRLPAAMRKITGDQGTPVDLGVHKNAFEQMDPLMQAANAAAGAAPRPPVGSPVFRNPDGTPKTNVTGLAFNISKAADQFHIARAPGRAAKTEPVLKPFVPRNATQKGIVDSIGATGLTALHALQRSDSAVMAGLGYALERNASSKAGLTEVKYVQGLDSPGYHVDTRNGRSLVVLDGGIISKLAPEVRLAVVAHEMLHAFTSEQLASNINFRKAVDGLRIEALSRLPKADQLAIRKALKSKWYDRWVNKEVTDMKELHPDIEQATLYYSFLNADEFISNGLTDMATYKLLRNMHVGDADFMTRLGRNIQALLGTEIPDTVFTNLLQTTFKIARYDGQIASARNAVEVLLENEGYAPEFVQDYAETAFAVLHTMQAGKGEFLLTQILDTQSPTRRDELALVSLERSYNPELPEYKMVNRVLQESGLTEGIDGIKALREELLLGTLQDGQRVLELMPDNVRLYVNESANYTGAVLKGLELLTDGQVARVEGWHFDPEQTATVKELLSHVGKYNKMDQELTMLTRDLESVTNLEISAYLDNVHRAPESVYLGKDTKEQQVSKLTQFWMRASTLARIEPLFAEAVTKGYQLLANARNSTIKALEPFSIDLRSGEVSQKAAQFLFDSIKQRPIVKAVDEILYKAQEAGLKTGKVQAMDFESQQVKSILAKLTPDQQEAAKQLLSSKSISQQIANENTLQSMRHVAEIQASTLIADQTGLPVDQTLALTRELFETHLMDKTDPGLHARLVAVQQRMEFPTFMTLLKATETQAAIYKEWQQIFADNPWWTSARRYGKIQAELSNGDRISADTEIELAAQAKEVGARIMSKTRTSRSDEAPHFGKVLESAIPRLRELESNMHEMLAKVLSPEDLALVKRRSPVEQFAVEARESGLTNVQAHGRRLGKGAQHVPYLRNHFSFVQQNATYWARQRYAAEISLLLKNPAYESRPDVVAMIKQQGENILYPDPEHASTVTRFVTHYLLGFNPSSALVNGSQLFIRGAAELTALNGSPLKSYKSLLNVLAELGSGKWASPEHEAVMKRAVADGEVGLSKYDEVQATQEVVAANISRRVAGSAPVNVAQYTTRGIGALANASMFLFRQIEMLNTRGALLMGYDHWRSQGLSVDAAYQKATEFNHFINDTGGRVNRSLGAFSGRDAFSRSTAMVSNSMMAYVLGTAGQLATYIKQGFFQKSSLTPAERFKARLALTQMLTVQFAAAGTMGMPFMAGMVAVLEKAFPDLELTKNIREFFNELFADDDESGNPLADAAMTGLPSLMGWDFQSRLSMGAIPGVNDFDGFQPQQLLGAPLSVASNLLKGSTKLVQGDISGTRDILPPAFKKLFDLVANEGKMSDHRDRPILHPTPAETMGAALGFNPKRLSDFNAASRMANRSEVIASRVRGRERQEMANEILKGNIGTVRQQLLARQQAEPEFDARAEIRALSATAEALVFPRDLRREGGASGERSKILKTFRLAPNAGDSEQARVMFRQQIEMQLGLRPRSTQAVQEARTLDALRQQYPDATRSELRRMLATAARKQPLL